MIALVLVAHSAAHGEDTVRVTVDDALALLHRQSPELLADGLRVQAPRGDVVTARLLPNPTLSGSVGNLPLGRTNPRGLGPGDTVVTSVGVEEEIQLWGRQRARVDAARGREEAADAEHADLDRRLTFEVRSRFVTLLEAGERLRLAREDLGRYRETVRVSETRAHEGDISPAEFDKVALEQRRFEREVGDAEVERREAVAALLPLLGTDARDVEPVGTLAVPEVRDDIDRLVDEALARRPDLRAAERARETAEAALRLVRAQRWPDVTVGLQYTHSQFEVSGDLPNQLGTSLSLPLPVFNRNQGEIQRAEAEVLAARHGVDRLRLEIPQEVRSAATGYAVAHERVRRFEGAYLSQAEGARRAAEASYREGAVSLLEFLEAERAHIETQRDHLDALRDANVAAFALTRAAALEASP